MCGARLGWAETDVLMHPWSAGGSVGMAGPECPQLGLSLSFMGLLVLLLAGPALL